jgi:hypothetical protein
MEQRRDALLGRAGARPYRGLAAAPISPEWVYGTDAMKALLVLQILGQHFGTS